jgi:hypothetical protein
MIDPLHNRWKYFQALDLMLDIDIKKKMKK